MRQFQLANETKIHDLNPTRLRCLKRHHRLFFLLSPVLAADWPQQMGPNRDGVVPADNLAAEWKDGKLPVLWQTSAGFGTAPARSINGPCDSTPFRSGGPL